MDRHLVLKIDIEFDNFYYCYDYEGDVGLDTKQHKEQSLSFSNKLNEDIKFYIKIMFEDEYFLEHNLIYKIINIFENYNEDI